MRWRRWLFKLHRDIGFVCVGLTLVYGISGVAVNHRHDWNYNHSKELTTRQLGSARALLGSAVAATGQDETRLARQHQGRLVAALLPRLGRDQAPRNAFWRGPRRLSLFFGEGDGDVVDYDPVSGQATHERKRDRFLLRQLNALHLNEPESLWTWTADLFAVALLFLAISGVLMVKGRHGLRGRGGVLVGLGILVPVVAILLL
jgi:hypothetical protein